MFRLSSCGGQAIVASGGGAPKKTIDSLDWLGNKLAMARCLTLINLPFVIAYIQKDNNHHNDKIEHDILRIFTLREEIKPKHDIHRLFALN